MKKAELANCMTRFWGPEILHPHLMQGFSRLNTDWGVGEIFSNLRDPFALPDM
jgi:hypothetical protein